MTLLSIAQDVADVVGLTRPASIISSTDQLARQILGMAKETLDDLAVMDWPFLEIAYSFSTVNGTAQYIMPADFGRELGDTCYLASQYYPMRGSLSAGDWARQRNALPTQIGRYKFRLFGNPVKFNISPTPTTVETVALEYITTARVTRASDSALVSGYSADADNALFPDELMKKGIKWRLMRRKGLDYSEEFNDYEVSKARLLAQALALGSMPVAYRQMIENPEIPTGYVPEFGFGV